MNRDKLFKHWHRQYRQLLKRQDSLLRQSRNQGLPEQIHDLRVTLRRLRLMVRVSGPLIDPAVAEPYRRWSRRISNTTSHLRDFDVTLEWLATQRLHSATAKSLTARRQRLWKMGRHRLLPPPPAIRSAIRKLKSGKRARRGLSRRYCSRFARLHARVLAQIPGFLDLDESERHAFRRTVRLLRYLREFALPSRKRHHDPVIEALARPQEAMGEYQNILLARQIIGTLKSPAPSPALMRALLREQARWQDEIISSLNALATEKCHSKLGSVSTVA